MNTTNNKVKVVYGINEESLASFVGKSVQQVLDSINQTKMFSIPSEPKVYVNEEEVNKSFVLSAGDIMEIVKKSGEKGY